MDRIDFSGSDRFFVVDRIDFRFVQMDDGDGWRWMDADGWIDHISATQHN